MKPIDLKVGDVYRGYEVVDRYKHPAAVEEGREVPPEEEGLFLTRLSDGEPMNGVRVGALDKMIDEKDEREAFVAEHGEDAWYTKLEEEYPEPTSAQEMAAEGAIS